VEYVEKLRNSVARNLTIPHDFLCVTSHVGPDGVTRISPPRGGEGWWQKVNLFDPLMFPSGVRVLYLDLDVVVVGSLDKLASSNEPFCMIENYGPNKGHAAHNSSIMLWTPDEKTARIYNLFSDDVPKQLHGDQCWIWRVMRDDITDFHQNMAVSYKYEKASPNWHHADDKTAVVVFHGQPKPHQVKDQMIVQNWQ